MMVMSNPSVLHRRIALEGQSNAVGYGDATMGNLAGLSDSTLAGMAASAFERVYIFNPGSGNYEKLRIGTNNMASDSSHFGPEFGIAVRWMRETKRGNLYIDKNASGGQPIAYFMEGTSVFAALMTNTAAQNAWLAANKITAAHMGWVWLQGETNAGSTQSDYEASLTTYVNSRINHSLMTANGFRVLAQVPSNSTQYGAGPELAKAHYTSINPTTARLIPYGQLGSDSLHMSAKGCTQVGFNAFAQFFSRPSLALA